MRSWYYGYAKRLCLLENKYTEIFIRETIKCFVFNLQLCGWWGQLGKQGDTEKTRGWFKGSIILFLKSCAFEHFENEKSEGKEAPPVAATWRVAPALPRCHQDQTTQVGPRTHGDRGAEQCVRSPINQQAQLKPFSRGSLIRKIWFRWVILLGEGAEDDGEQGRPGDEKVYD